MENAQPHIIETEPTHADQVSAHRLCTKHILHKEMGLLLPVPHLQCPPPVATRPRHLQGLFAQHASLGGDKGATLQGEDTLCMRKEPGSMLNPQLCHLRDLREQG